MYCSQEDVVQRLDPVYLTDLTDDNQDGAPDTPVVEAAIADADALIDSYLAGRFRTPLETPPPLIRRFSIDLAIAGLFARRRETAAPLFEVRAKLALELLAGIARGEVMLPSLPPASAIKTAESTTNSREKTFDDKTLAGF